MSKKYDKLHGFQALTSLIHFHTAKLYGTTILVFQDGELIGNGRIREITETTITIGEYSYIIEKCSFTYLK